MSQLTFFLTRAATKHSAKRHYTYRRRVKIRYANSLTTAEGILGLSGFTVTFCIREFTTKSISSSGMAPNNTSSPKTRAPVKQVLFSNFI